MLGLSMHMPRLFQCVLVASIASSLWSSSAWAARITVEINPKVVVEGEDVTVSVRFQGEYDKYAMPKMDDFQVLGREQSSQISIVGGNVRQTRTYTIRAVPKKVGVLTIGAARAFLNGTEVAVSAPKRIRVRKEQPLPTAGSSDSGAVLEAAARRSEMIAHGVTNRKSVYVGEPFVVSWEVLLGSKYQLENYSTLSQADLSGFVSEDIADVTPRNRLVARRRRVAGKRFNSYRTGAQVLTAVKPGKAVIKGYRAEIGYSDRQRFGFSRRKVLKAHAFHVGIKPLPSGAPAGFDTASVGQFSLSVSLRDALGQSPKQLQTGQRLVLKAVVTGSGNIAGLQPPQLANANQRFEVQRLPTSNADKISRTVDGVEGERRFEFLLTALQNGTYSTPDVTLVYFDPGSESYKTAVAKGQELKVSGANLTAAGARASGQGGGTDIGPIIEDVALRHHSRRSFATTPLFWVLFGLPLFGFLFVELRHQRQRIANANPLQRKSRGAVASALKQLKAAEAKLGPGQVKDFYGAVARALTHFFVDRVQLPAVGLTHEELRYAALERGFSQELMERVVAELENCDFARFASSSKASEDMQATLSRAKSLIDDLGAVNVTEPSSDAGNRGGR